MNHIWVQILSPKRSAALGSLTRGLHLAAVWGWIVFMDAEGAHVAQGEQNQGAGVNDFSKRPQRASRRGQVTHCHRPVTGPFQGQFVSRELLFKREI